MQASVFILQHIKFYYLTNFSFNKNISPCQFFSSFIKGEGNQLFAKERGGGNIMTANYSPPKTESFLPFHVVFSPSPRRFNHGNISKPTFFKLFCLRVHTQASVYFSFKIVPFLCKVSIFISSIGSSDRVDLLLITDVLATPRSRDPFWQVIRKFLGFVVVFVSFSS